MNEALESELYEQDRTETARERLQDQINDSPRWVLIENAPDLLDAIEQEAVERERARIAEAVEAMPGTAWNGTTEGGKRLDWLVERAAVLALLVPDSTGARE